MAELADAADSKSVVLKRRVGSTPTFGTPQKNSLESNPVTGDEALKNLGCGQVAGQDPGQTRGPREALIGALANAVRDARLVLMRRSGGERGELEGLRGS